MSRRSHTQLVALAGSLSPRRWELLRAVEQVRLATGDQLTRRFYGSGSAAERLARLDLAYLYNHSILHRLERRIGGARAGSTGFIYALGPVGRRLLDYERGDGVTSGRSRYEPTVGFVQHALAVTEVWVGLHEYLTDSWTGERDAEFDFLVERNAWRSYPAEYGNVATLKPDAEVWLRRQDTEECFWLEVDRATERRATIRRKLDAYASYYRTGLEQAERDCFPLTVWLTTTPARARVLEELVAELPGGSRRLFKVGLLSAASPFLLSYGRVEL
jgi:hypothetical protein